MHLSRKGKSMEMHYLLHHVFTNSWQRVPDKHAVIDNQRQLSYSQLNKLAGVLAQKLKESGIERGDRVAFFLDHDCNQAISILAISSLGAVFIPVNRLLHPDQVRHIVFDSGSKVLITTRERLSQVTEVMETCDELKEILLADELDGENYLERTTPAIENDLAAILYTSGSSGRPKGVMLSHKNLLSGCWIVSEYLKLHGEDRLLGVLPLSFDYGLNQLLTMLALGGTYVFSSFKYPNDIVSDLVRHKITGLAGIPPIWALLVRSSLEDTDLPDLRYISNSGGAVATSILDRLRKALPETDVFLMYGLTEAFRSTYLPPHQLDARPTSMGKA
ncbi:MAG: AMP-binding protein, partial [Planctomycetes bacterium]|nr:AMP-binding protein [Planctomycetota bacterium]